MWLVLMLLAAEPVLTPPSPRKVAVLPAGATDDCTQASDCTAVRLPCSEGWASVDLKSAPAAQAESAKRQRALDCVVSQVPVPKSVCVARHCAFAAASEPKPLKAMTKKECLRNAHAEWTMLPGGYGCLVRPFQR